jgi:hypothetical protein
MMTSLRVEVLPQPDDRRIIDLFLRRIERRNAGFDPA